MADLKPLTKRSTHKTVQNSDPRLFILPHITKKKT